MHKSLMGRGVDWDRLYKSLHPKKAPSNDDAAFPATTPPPYANKRRVESMKALPEPVWPNGKLYTIKDMTLEEWKEDVLDLLPRSLEIKIKMCVLLDKLIRT